MMYGFSINVTPLKGVNKQDGILLNFCKAKYNASYQEYKKMEIFFYQCKKWIMKVQDEVLFSEQVVAIIWKLWQGKRAQSRMPKTHGNSNCVVDQWMSPVNACFSKVLAYTNVRLRALHHTGVVTIYFCEFLMINSWYISSTLEFHYSPQLLFTHSLFL